MRPPRSVQVEGPAIPELFSVSCLCPSAAFVHIVPGIWHLAVTLIVFLAHLLLVSHFHVSEVRPLPPFPLLPSLGGHKTVAQDPTMSDMADGRKRSSPSLMGKWSPGEGHLH